VKCLWYQTRNTLAPAICGVFKISQVTNMPFTSEHYIAIGIGLIIGAGIVALILFPKLASQKKVMNSQLLLEKQKADESAKKLKLREVELDGIRQQTVELQQRKTELQTRIDAERKSSKEKEALLERAQAQLGNTFKALSADALESNQKRFLQLAESSFKAHQEKAGMELDKRNVAVESVVKGELARLKKHVREHMPRFLIKSKA